ncbi:MAG: hypothetical protein AB7D40_00485 [Bacteroidales bacterium]
MKTIHYITLSILMLATSTTVLADRNSNSRSNRNELAKKEIQYNNKKKNKPSFSLHVDIKPIVINTQRHRNSRAIHPEAIAEQQTRNLDRMLRLSDRQAKKIYRIHLNFLTHPHRNRHLALEKRERQVLNVLNRRQRSIYVYHMHQTDGFHTEYAYY